MNGRTGPLLVVQHLRGAWVPGEGPDIVTSTSPSDAAIEVASGRAASVDQVNDATAAVRDAWRGWADRTLHDRAGIMTAVADGVDAQALHLAETLCREVGKPVAEARAEVARAAEIFRYFATSAVHSTGELYASSDRGEVIESRRRPRGVFAIVTPFNFPLALPAWKLAAALVSGNGVVWKPSEEAAGTSQLLAQVMLSAGVAPDVFAVVQGGRAVGEAVVEQADLAGVSFTGSTPVGLGLIAQGGLTALPIQAEMGGSNAAVVLADADLDLAARTIMAGAFGSCGQRCTATRRVVCESTVYDDLVTRMVLETADWPAGDPCNPEVRVGPVISEAARDRVEHAVDDARRQGARLLAEGPLHSSASSRGSFVRPRLLEVSDVNSHLWTDEVFGPVVTILRVEGEEAALQAARHADFGLSAAVFTDSQRAARRFDDELDVGVLHINGSTTGAAPHVPFGGIGGSGFGPMEQGVAAQEFFTTRRTTYVRSTW